MLESTNQKYTTPVAMSFIINENELDENKRRNSEIEVMQVEDIELDARIWA